MKEANPNNKAMQRTTLKDGAGKKKKSPQVGGGETEVRITL